VSEAMGHALQICHLVVLHWYFQWKLFAFGAHKPKHLGQLSIPTTQTGDQFLKLQEIPLLGELFARIE
jgi:hypothetical protein